ncbi:uncharacterized protein METZ01_LOCUS388542, partial [marine metagenome]
VPGAAENYHEVVGYWNGYNTHVKYTIPVQPTDIDLTMNNGRVDLLAKINTQTSWDTLGSIGSDDYYFAYENEQISPLEIVVDSILTDDIGVEDINAFEDGLTIQFSAVLYDRAGNPVNYSDDWPILVIDETPPEVTTVTSTNENGIYNEGDVINISVITSETIVKDDVVEQGDDATVKLNANNNEPYPDAIFESHVDDTINFTYTVETGHSTEKILAGDAIGAGAEIGTCIEHPDIEHPEIGNQADCEADGYEWYDEYLNYLVANTSLELQDSYYFRDIAGNNLTTTLPPL